MALEFVPISAPLPRGILATSFADIAASTSETEVDAWYAGRVEKLKEEAERRRHAHRAAAGKALHAMRLRGETIASISSTTSLSVSRLRELLKFASEDHTENAAQSETPDAQVVALPNRMSPETGDYAPPEAALGAH